MITHARMLMAALAALVLSAALATAADAAVPMLVRVEINQSNILHGLVDRTPVSLDPATPVTISGVSCPGDSAVAALQQAIPGQFTLTSDGAGTRITRLKNIPVSTLAAPPAGPSWVVYVGGVRQTDICASLTQNQSSTEVLAYLQCGTLNTSASNPCFTGWPLLLRAIGGGFWPTQPYLVQGGGAVMINRSGDGGFPTAATTAQVNTDEERTFTPTVPWPGDGTTDVAFTNRGDHILVATDTTGGRSWVPDRIPMCSTDGHDGNCGTTAVTPPPFDVGDYPAPCTTNGHDGFCGTTDTSGPVTHVTNITNKKVYKTKKGPGQVKGTIDVDPNGVGAVKLRLTRVLTTKVKVKVKTKRKKGSKKKPKTRYRYKTVKRCYAWDDDSLLLLATKKCGTKYGTWWTAELSDLRNEFSYSFAMAMPKGTYTLEVSATDEDGHVDAPAAGRNVLTFTVR